MKSGNNRFSVFNRVYEQPTKSEHFHIPITVRSKNKSQDVVAMIDSGASTLFINQRFVDEHKIHTYKLKTPIPVTNIDGTLNKAGAIMDMAVLATERTLALLVNSAGAIYRCSVLGGSKTVCVLKSFRSLASFSYDLLL